jgi:hypothetical protein
MTLIIRRSCQNLIVNPFNAGLPDDIAEFAAINSSIPICFSEISLHTQQMGRQLSFTIKSFGCQSHPGQIQADGIQERQIFYSESFFDGDGEVAGLVSFRSI